MMSKLRKIYKSRNITLIKYLIAFGILLFCFLKRNNPIYFIVQIFELCFIIIISNRISKKWPKKIVNSILLILLEINVFTLAFSNTYVSEVMLSNLNNLQDLSGHKVAYLSAAVLIIIDTILPINQIDNLKAHKLDLKRISTNILSFVLGIELVITLIAGNSYSPLFNSFLTGYKYASVLKKQSLLSSTNPAITDFYKNKVDSYVDKPSDLADKPNIVLIFTEGLSQNIVDDDRNIMPNVRNFEDSAINFQNYYNHTFATYRGLVGQLYSGYVYKDGDTDNLPSLQSILQQNGYYTSFINTEPNNFQFMKYLDSFGFDSLINDKNAANLGPANSMSDKEAYEKLWNVINSSEKKDKPFLTCIYTFGTHVSFDSPDEKFGDGEDRLANRFYNADVQFGRFMEKFLNSSLSDNTIIVYTADHCTFQDDDFTKSFQGYERISNECDRIPLFIYYKNSQSQQIDVDGRTSVGLAPTILDFIDISGENYFLGTSLFGNMWSASEFDDLWCVMDDFLDTSGGSIKPLTSNTSSEITDKMNRYYAATHTKVGQ